MTKCRDSSATSYIVRESGAIREVRPMSSGGNSAEILLGFGLTWMPIVLRN